MKIFTVHDELAQIWTAYTTHPEVVGHGRTEHQSIGDLADRLLYRKTEEFYNFVQNEIKELEYMKNNIIVNQDNNMHMFNKGQIQEAKNMLQWLESQDDKDIQE